MLDMLGVPIAESYAALGETPARLVDDVFLYQIGKNEGEAERAKENNKRQGKNGGINPDIKRDVRAAVAARQQHRDEFEESNGRR